MFKQIKTYVGILAAFFHITTAQADVNIAVVAPQTGDQQAFGTELISGVKTAIDLINEAGGLKGQRINLITINDACDDRLSVATAKMIASNTGEKDKISLVIGPYCGNKFGEVAKTYADAKIFQIIPTSIPEEDEAENHPGLAKLSGDNRRQSTDFYNFYDKSFSGRNVAIIYDSENREIVDIAAAVQQEFKKHNALERLKAYSYGSFDDIDDLVEKVLEDKNNIAYILGTPKQTAEVASQLKDENEHFIIFANKYKAQKDYNEIMGKMAEKIFYVGLPSLSDNPNFAETLVQLRLKGVEPEGLGVYGFSAVKFWEGLVEKGDSFDYDRLASAMANGPVKTLWGETTVKNGTPENLPSYGIYIRMSGQYAQVY